MMFLDLFPVGMYQLWVVFTEGFWVARSQELLRGPVWQFFTYARSIGGTLFIVGGVLPLVWFILSRGGRLNRESADPTEGEWAIYYAKDWAGMEGEVAHKDLETADKD